MWSTMIIVVANDNYAFVTLFISSWSRNPYVIFVYQYDITYHMEEVIQ